MIYDNTVYCDGPAGFIFTSSVHKKDFKNSILVKFFHKELSSHPVVARESTLPHKLLQQRNNRQILINFFISPNQRTRVTNSGSSCTQFMRRALT